MSTLSIINESEQDLDPRQVARGLVPLLREQAKTTEDSRKISPVVMGALHETQLFKLLQPAAYGGKEESYALLLEVLQILGEGCLSTAWVGFNAASHLWMLGMWPKEVQDAIWHNDADALISSSLIFPAGRAVPTEDGSAYIFSGKWAFSSGVDHASYIMLGALVQSDDATLPPKKVIGIVPKDQVEVIDTWFVSGLCGTGSKNLDGQNIRVEAAWVIDADSLSDCTAPGLIDNTAPVFRVPVIGMFPHLTAAVMLGNAQGLLDEFMEGASKRKTTYSKMQANQFVSLQMKVAEAQVLITSGTHLIQHDAIEAMAIAARNEPAPQERQVTWRMNAAFAAKQATQAVDLMFAAYGGGGNYRTNRAQRRFRDAHAAISHIQVSWDINAAEYGRFKLAE